MSNLNNLSAERIAALLALEEKENVKKAKHLAYSKRRNAEMAILVIKAKKANITVSDEEVEKYLKDNK